MCNSLHELMAMVFSARFVLIFALCLAVVSTVSWAFALETSKQHVLCQNEDDAVLCKCVMYLQVLAEAPNRSSTLTSFTLWSSLSMAGGLPVQLCICR